MTRQALICLNNLYSKGDFTLEEGVIQGELTIDNNSIELLQFLENEGQLVQINIERPTGPNLIDRLVVGEIIKITIEIARTSRAFFGLNLDDLLTSASNKYCREVPELCVLHEENWCSWDEDELSINIVAYLKVIEFVNYLNVVKSYNGNSGFEYGFLGAKEKLELKIIYNSNVIEENAQEIIGAVDAILSLMTEENHREDKERQFRIALINLLSNTNIESKFEYLLKNIELFKQRLFHNHELFISGFSFEDERDLLAKEHREYTAILNEVITKIHTRIIGIPLGTVLPAFLIKTSEKGVDFIVFLSAVFIAIVIGFSLKSQFQLLERVKNEYEIKWSRMKTEIPNLLVELERDFIHLSKCYQLNWKLLVFFSIALALFVSFPIWAYFSKVFQLKHTFVEYIYSFIDTAITFLFSVSLCLFN